MKSKKDRGAALAEVAVVLPLFLMLVLGMAVLGLSINAKTVLNNAAREGGRLAAVGATTVDVEARMKQILQGSGIRAENVLINITELTSDVQITVTYLQPTFVPFARNLFGSEFLTIRSTSIFRLEG